MEWTKKVSFDASHLSFKSDYEPSYQRCLLKAVSRVQNLLTQDETIVDDARIHAAKSLLYAAIEQMGTQMEKMGTIQRLLRELLLIANSQYESPGRDRELGLQILADIRSKTDFFG
jgi:hypothetical protein